VLKFMLPLNPCRLTICWESAPPAGANSCIVSAAEKQAADGHRRSARRQTQKPAARDATAPRQFIHNPGSLRAANILGWEAIR